MKFRSEFWKKDYVTQGTISQWPCPECYLGFLKINKFNSDNSNSSAAAIFSCSNENCIQQFSACGSIKYWSEEHQCEVDNLYMLDKIIRFYPKSFYPPLQLFKTPNSCNDLVKRKIIDAFSHFWSDNNATLNAIRISLECLMDHFEIPNMPTLGNRINKFLVAYPDCAIIVKAIRLLGNSGSHNETASKADVINALEFTSNLLERVFPACDQAEIESKAQSVINTLSKKR